VAEAKKPDRLAHQLPVPVSAGHHLYLPAAVAVCEREHASVPEYVNRCRHTLFDLIHHVLVERGDPPGGAEQSNETAGEHFTPREVIKLMVNVLFINLNMLQDLLCGTQTVEIEL